MYLNKILVTTDFSEHSVSACSVAAHEARAGKCDLTLLHVAEQLHLPDWFKVSPEALLQIEKQSLAQSAAKLKAFAATHCKEPDVKQISLKENTSAADTICEYAKKNKFGLIVITSRGRSALERLFIGSTAERVIRLAPCPVLVVPPQQNDRRSWNLPFKHILATTDLSADSRLAFRYAAHEAKMQSARVTLAYVRQELFAPALFEQSVSGNISVQQMQQEFEKELQGKLAEFAREYFPLAGTETKIIEKGISAAQSITEYAATARCDLIALSTHGAGKGSKLIGGVAENVLRHATCPVLVVPKIK